MKCTNNKRTAEGGALQAAADDEPRLPCACRCWRCGLGGCAALCSVGIKSDALPLVSIAHAPVVRLFSSRPPLVCPSSPSASGKICKIDIHNMTIMRTHYEAKHPAVTLNEADYADA